MGVIKRINGFQKLINSLNTKGLAVSYEKLNTVTFAGQRVVLPNKIMLAVVNVPHSNETMFLGVIIVKKLTWQNHNLHVIRRSERSINILRAITGNKWGTDPNIRLIFYRAAFKTVLDYDSIVYGSPSNTWLKKIDVCQQKCLRL